MLKSGTILSLLLAGVSIAFAVSQPYAGDWFRFMWWRLTGPPMCNGTIDTGDAKIRYKIVGAGPPLVMMHGGLSSSIDWYSQIPVLAQKFQLILIDQRGHGGSTIGKQPFTYQLHAKDVIQVLDTLSLPLVDIVGWSDGGNIGLVIAKNQPQRVRRLVAISANAFPEGLTDEALSSIDAVDPERPSLFTRMLYHFQSPDPGRLGELTGSVVHMWQNYPSFTLQNLNDIDTPVLLIIGEQDGVSLQHARFMNSALANSTLRVVKSAGHNVPQAASKQLTQWLLDFLQHEVS